MFQLQYPLHGSRKTAFALRSHPSLAHDLVAGLENLPGRAARPQNKDNNTRLRYMNGMVSVPDYGNHPILYETFEDSLEIYRADLRIR
jgi:hypothetical protein